METASVPIEIRGRYFWRGDERFVIRGIVYQDYHHKVFTRDQDRIPNDEIADDRLEQLEHDIGLFKELGINAIFVYSIDSSKFHDRAMKRLEEAGIYVLATLGGARWVINRLQPYESYNTENLSHFFRVADTLAAYPNCLGVVAGDNIINDNQTTGAAQVIRAVVRDVKRYLRLKHEVTGQRVLPVGYSAACVVQHEAPTREYLAAGDEASRIDFFSKNDYSWASPSDMQMSGYNRQIETYSDYNIPAFFSEYGANCNQPRDFGEIAALLSPEMTHVFSGGFAYEFWRGSNMYGLVKRVTGKEAAKWRRAHTRFQQISVEDLSRDVANMTLDEFLKSPRGHEVETNERGTSRRLDRTIAEYRESPIGEIVLYKDFINLKRRIASMKDVPANTDPEWADSSVTAARAPSFPSASRVWSVEGEGEVPPSPIDWTQLEERVRDGEYVLVDEREEAEES